MPDPARKEEGYRVPAPARERARVLRRGGLWFALLTPGAGSR
jgi:hypothetical protein